MSQSIIEKLLKGAEVEWKPLGEMLIENIGGGTPSKSKQEYWAGEIPWASVGDLNANGNYVRNTRNKISLTGLKHSPTKLIKKGYVVVATRIFPGKMKIADIDLAINQDLRGLKLNNNIIAEYLNYYFQTINFQGNGTIVKAITSKDIEQRIIPIPPLSVQKEIVRILDAFTAHTAELTAELNERKKQYNYYLNKLLTFSGDEVEWKTVEEIITTVTPPLKIPRGKYNLSGNIPIVDQGENFIAGYTDNADAALPENEYIIFGDHTEYIKYVDFSFAQGADGLKILKPNRDLAKYVYYAFLNFYNKTGKYKRHWTDAKKILLPIVSIKAQKRIVSILDKFDALTTSISEGLPREIELRNKQYEYYRDQLLNFSKLDLEN